MRKIVGILLTVILVVSMCCVGIPVSAVDTDKATIHVYDFYGAVLNDSNASIHPELAGKGVKRNTYNFEVGDVVNIEVSYSSNSQKLAASALGEIYVNQTSIDPTSEDAFKVYTDEKVNTVKFSDAYYTSDERENPMANGGYYSIIGSGSMCNPEKALEKDEEGWKVDNDAYKDRCIYMVLYPNEMGYSVSTPKKVITGITMVVTEASESYLYTALNDVIKPDITAADCHIGNDIIVSTTLNKVGHIEVEQPKNKVSVFGDINLELTESDENVYSGTVDLNAGTYNFRVNEFGTKMCYGQIFTDIMNGIKYSSSYSSATRFKATGGRYTFTYNTAKDMLIIKHKPFSEIVELFGDINVELVRTSSASTVFTGSARVEAGTYKYKINDQGVTKGFGYTFNDAVHNIGYKAEWSGSTTFNATGGIYSVSYDTATSKLTFKHAPKGLGDVRIFGDVNIDLAKEYGTVYSATQTLEAGTYEIRVDSFGKTLCNGSTFTDYISKEEYKATWKSATKFNARGGKYTFKFDSSTNQLTVLYAPIEEKVSIFGDINLELKSNDNVKYTGKVNLTAGKYSFRIDDFGTTYCYGMTIKDSKAKIQYSTKYKSATILDATGGTYSFTYDKSNNQLTVLKTA